MKSKLTIEVDFEDRNTPCIRILAAYTDDVRDKLLKDFLERLDGESLWCTIGCVGVTSTDPHSSYSEWVIKPVYPKDVEEEITRMKLLVGSKPRRPRPQHHRASDWDIYCLQSGIQKPSALAEDFSFLTVRHKIGKNLKTF